MAFGAGRTGPLYRHGNDHLTDRRAILRPLLTTRPINESDQIQLLGNPHQSANITGPLGTDGPNQAQIRDGGRVGRAQNSLPRERTLPAGIPHRLGCDAVSPAPPRARRCSFLSSSHRRVLVSSETCANKGGGAPSRPA